ncbi:Uncharacterized protein Adt_13540 [Abeliophyllum distichum]|uniref:Uncharacterized protein n=1 Tax=Abeliophyllum distichum TaxID=126358 RepID=A0ABD1TXN2_9LAMI
MNRRRTDLAGSKSSATAQITDLCGRRQRRSKGVGAHISNMRAGRVRRSRTGAYARRSQIDLRVAPLVALRSALAPLVAARAPCSEMSTDLSDQLLSGGHCRSGFVGELRQRYARGGAHKSVRAAAACARSWATDLLAQVRRYTWRRRALSPAVSSLCFESCVSVVVVWTRKSMEEEDPCLVARIGHVWLHEQ